MTSSSPAPAALNLDGEQQKLVSKLREWLHPTKFDSPGGEYAKHVRAYIPGTGAWLRKSPEFRAWFGEAVLDSAPQSDQLIGTESGCLWVKGVPGSGKSVFSASVVQLLRDVDPATPVLFFFFRQIVQQNHDPKYLIRDFASQLLPYSPLLRDDLFKLSKTAQVDGMERSQVWDALLRAIGSMDKLFCIIDALDEMDNEHFDFINSLRDLRLNDQQRVKVLLTSRPLPNIEATLRSPGIIQIKLQPSMIYPDTVRYANVRLGSLVPRLSLEKEQLVKDTICQRAKGLFLHARIIIDNLTESLKSDLITERTLPESLERLPGTLKGVYEQMLVEHAARSGVDTEQQVRILSCVINSSRPMRVIELGSILAHMHGPSADLKMGKALVKEGCGRLLEILEDETVSVIHHSFTEFLRDNTRRNTRGAFPVLDSYRANREISVALLGYLDAVAFRPVPVKVTNEEPIEDNISEIDSENGIYITYDEIVDVGKAVNFMNDVIEDLRVENPLMEYALSNWIYHVKKTNQDDPEVMQALHKFLCPGKSAFELWARDSSPIYPYDPSLKSIHLAAQVGLTTYAEKLIEADPTLVNAKQVEGLTPLAIAARNGRTEIARLLLDHGARPNSVDKIGWRPIHHCVFNRQVGVAKLLLEKGVSPWTKTARYRDNRPNKSALQVVFEDYDNDSLFQAFLPFLTPGCDPKCIHWVNDAKKLEEILKIGVSDIDSFHNGMTKLFRSAKMHDAESVKLLLKYGADPNRRCSLDRQHIENEDEQEPIGEVHYPNGLTPMHAFAGAGINYGLCDKDLDSARWCLQQLVDAGGDINAKCYFDHPEFGKDENWTPLHFGVVKYRLRRQNRDKSESPLTALLVDMGADVNAATANSNTPAHVAFESCPSVFKILAQHGADLNKRNSQGNTPLMCFLDSINWPSLETLDVILSSGGDATAVDDKGNGSIHTLFNHRRLDLSLFRRLVSAGADLNKKNLDGKAPLHCYTGCLESGDNEDVLRELIKDGLDINARDSDGMTILTYRVSQSWVGMEPIETLVRLGADVSVIDNNCKTLLHTAMKKQHDTIQLIRFLVSKGVDFMARDYEGSTLVQLAKEYLPKDAAREIVDYLVHLGVPNSDKNSKGQTELHLSSTKRDVRYSLSDSKCRPLPEVLREYLMNSTSVDQTDNLEATPLHYAASVCEQNVWRLLTAGADPTRLTIEGVSPLHIAAVARQPNIIGLLLSEYAKRGVLEAMINLRSNDVWQRTALHYACRSGRPESVRYLIDHGADVHAIDAHGLTPLYSTLEFPDESLLWKDRPKFEYLIQTTSLARPRQIDSYRDPKKGPGPARITDIISMLAEAGCDFEAEIDVEGILMTPLEIACEIEFGEMVMSLLDLGAEPRCGTSVSELFNHSEFGAEVELLHEISNGKEILVNVRDWYDSYEFKCVPYEVFRLLENGKSSVVKKFAHQGGNFLTMKKFEDYTTLHVLVKSGCTSLVRLLHDQAIRLGSLDCMKTLFSPSTLLAAACFCKMPNLPMIKVLVEEVGLVVNEISRPSECSLILPRGTPLHFLAFGAYWWHIDALKYLLQHGADIEYHNEHGQTPLLAAISPRSKSIYIPREYESGFWNEQTVKLLLEHGANANVRGNSDSPSSCLASAKTAVITKLLLQHGADPKDPMNLESLTHAVELLDEEIADLLLEAGQDVNACVKKRYPLHEAARIKIPSDRTEKRRSMVNFLLKRGADPFRTYPSGENILEMVLENHGIYDMFLELEELDIDRLGSKWRTLLISACIPTAIPSEEDEEDEEEEDDDEEDEYGIYDSYEIDDARPPPLLTSKSQAVTRLLSLGASVDVIDGDGRSALHWFSTMTADFGDQDKEAFNALLEKGPSLIHLRDFKGSKPIHLALKAGQSWAVHRLAETGADIKEADHNGNNALHHYAAFLVGNRTRATEAAKEFEWFISQGVDIEARNSSGETPLIVFISAGWQPKEPDELKNAAVHTEYLHLFLNAQADVRVRNTEGGNLLHVLASQNNPYRDVLNKDAVDTFKQLMELGVDPRAEDSKMRTAIDYAVARYWPEIVRLFRGKDKKVSWDGEDEYEQNEEISDGESEPGYEVVESVGLDS